MIFAHTLDQLLQGAKSQTRRIAKPLEAFQTTDLRVVATNRTVYQVGKTYAVQPNRGKKAIGRILLTGIRHETISQITEADALAEGFTSRQAFLTAWRGIHGSAANLEQLVWVLEFKLCTIFFEELQKLHDKRCTTHESLDYSKNLPNSLQEISGNRLYSGHYGERGVGEIISSRFPLLASSNPVQKISMD